MTELSTEQLVQMHQLGDRPLKVIDPDTQKVYVIIAGELYDRLRPLLDDSDFDVSESSMAQSRVAGAAGWDDPEMDVYDDYDRNKPQR